MTLACCKDRLQLPPHIVDFVIPLGTTVNMDGTGERPPLAAIAACRENARRGRPSGRTDAPRRPAALYEAVAVLYIAQTHDVHLGFTGTIIVALTATLAGARAPAAALRPSSHSFPHLLIALFPPAHPRAAPRRRPA